ncbi:MAG: hypothetical protein QXF61_11460 [Nitrososphaeria archaeon]
MASMLVQSVGKFKLREGLMTGMIEGNNKDAGSEISSGRTCISNFSPLSRSLHRAR